MNAEFSEYIQNIKTVSESMTVTVSPDMSEQEVIERIQENAAKLYALHCRNDEILKDAFFSKKPEDVGREEIDRLIEFADALGRRDYPIFYKLYKFVHDWALLNGDKRLVIRSCYWISIALYYLRIMRREVGIDLFSERIAEYLSEVEDCINDYDLYDDDDTKAYIIRNNANRRLVASWFNITGGDVSNEKSFSWYQNHLALVKETVKIITDPKKREAAPSLPWDSYLCVTCQSVSSMVMRLRDSVYTNEEYKVVSADVLKAAEYVLKYEEEREKNTGKPVTLQTRYRYITARYHSGLITAEELLDYLCECYSKADREDFTSEGIFANIRMPLYMQYYSGLLSAEGHKKFDPKVKAASDCVSEYLMLMPRNKYVSEMSQDLRVSLFYRTTTHTTYRQQVLEYILACHPPTYIHSRMVSWLAEELFRQLVKVNPDALVGVLGMENRRTVIDGAELIAETVRLCGLYHDLGKCMIIDHVGNYTRRLTDEEFEAIKTHPLLGAQLLRDLGGFEDHAGAALYHHRSYDGKGGYPDVSKKPIPRRNRAIIDIITVADSLEAGTDNVGRCYAATKTAETLFNEIKQWAGTRYSPAVAALFEDKEFCDRISEEMTRQRRKIYYETYIDLAQSEKSKFKEKAEVQEAEAAKAETETEAEEAAEKVTVGD